MGRTYFTTPIDRRAVYDRAFFEKLFEALTRGNFEEIIVTLPHTNPSRPRDLTPDEFLKVTEQLDGVYVHAMKPTNPTDRFEFVVARRDARKLFPMVPWTDDQQGRAFISVMSFDAPRPFALASHFARFAHDNTTRPGLHPVLFASNCVLLTLQTVSLLWWHHLMPIYPKVPLLDTSLYVLVALSTFFSATAPSGVVMHERPSLLDRVRPLFRGGVNNPFFFILYGAIAAAIGATIYGFIKARWHLP